MSKFRRERDREASAEALAAEALAAETLAAVALAAEALATALTSCMGALNSVQDDSWKD